MKRAQGSANVFHAQRVCVQSHHQVLKGAPTDPYGHMSQASRSHPSFRLAMLIGKGRYLAGQELDMLHQHKRRLSNTSIAHRSHPARFQNYHSYWRSQLKSAAAQSKRHWLCHHSARLAQRDHAKRHQLSLQQSVRHACSFWQQWKKDQKQYSNANDAKTSSSHLGCRCASWSLSLLNHSQMPASEVHFQLAASCLEAEMLEGQLGDLKDQGEGIRSPPPHHIHHGYPCKWCPWYISPGFRWLQPSHHAVHDVHNKRHAFQSTEVGPGNSGPHLPKQLAPLRRWRQWPFASVSSFARSGASWDTHTLRQLQVQQQV